MHLDFDNTDAKHGRHLLNTRIAYHISHTHSEFDYDRGNYPSQELHFYTW